MQPFHHYQIRQLLEADPFRPFVIRMSDGRMSFRIEDPGTLRTSSDGDPIRLQSAEHDVLINPGLIAAIFVDRSARADSSNQKG
jgi:hypothetical protein